MNELAVLNEKASRAREAGGEAGSREYLTFAVRGEVYAAGILAIKEIIEYGSVTAVPMVPDFIHGVINLRGRVVPVIDLLARLRGQVSEINRRSSIVVVEVEDEGTKQELGVLIDSVSAVVDISSEQIEPPPSFGTRLRIDFIVGMGKLNDAFVTILNLPNVLSIDEMQSLAKLARE
jgi:purine-binding chemotaxis protein CheW